MGACLKCSEAKREWRSQEWMDSGVVVHNTPVDVCPECGEERMVLENMFAIEDAVKAVRAAGGSEYTCDKATFEK